MTTYNSEIECSFQNIENNQFSSQNCGLLNKNEFTIRNLSSYSSNFDPNFDLDNIKKVQSSLEEFRSVNTKEMEKLYFIVDSEKEVNNKFTKQKRGRIRKRIECQKYHDINSTDNIQRKIQVHYLSFIISFLNDILKKLKYKQKFFKLNYEFKQNVKKEFVESLKKKTLGEIVCNKISYKYKKKNMNLNSVVYEQMKEKNVIKNILSENYVSFFKKIYYKSNPHISLKEYGLNINIILSKKVKMYTDLLEKNGILNYNNELKKNMNDCLIKYFMPNCMFLFH